MNHNSFTRPKAKSYCKGNTSYIHVSRLYMRKHIYFTDNHDNTIYIYIYSFVDLQVHFLRSDSDVAEEDFIFIFTK